MAYHTSLGVALVAAPQATSHITTFLDVEGLIRKVVIMLAVTRRSVVSHAVDGRFVRTSLVSMLSRTRGSWRVILYV